ncbi:hypothetical protein [Luteolibacter pohnpeiensis]|uniref:hypothetical protein n=1 Tax=Luteolibacter pohnpeiensis TaxID=454153 RepID=UPI0019038C4E|nr:hypothetical protein [Luteolibacter pohnpeiensis]
MKLSASNPIKLLLIAAVLLCSASGEELRKAPNFDAKPVDQLTVAGNACGPAALLASFRFGDDPWRKVADDVPGDTERERILSIIRKEGSRLSTHLDHHIRWSRKGVNVVDLCDMANEMTLGRYLPRIEYEIFILKNREDQSELLKRVHSRLSKSLAKGLPPMISLRRFANRSGKEQGKWEIVDGHFVTVIGISKKLPRGADSFAVTYLDPWGGKRCEGVIKIPQVAFLQPGNANPDPQISPSLEADFPEAGIGKSRLGKEDLTVITVAAGIGRW